MPEDSRGEVELEASRYTWHPTLDALSGKHACDQAGTSHAIVLAALVEPQDGGAGSAFVAQ
jgi:hypothetical protein